MSLQLALAIDAHDPVRVAGFWADILGRAVDRDARGVLLPGSDTQVGLRVVKSDSQRIGPNCVHLHVTSTSLADQEATVAAAVSLGGSHSTWANCPRRNTSC